MIARMKKITILVSRKSQEDFLIKLRKAGAVHIKDIQVPAASDIAGTEDKISRLKAALNYLPASKPSLKRRDIALSAEDALGLADKIISNRREKEQLIKDLHDAEEKLLFFEPWGAFDPNDLAELKKAGITIRLYRLTRSELKKLDPRDRAGMEVIKSDRNYAYLAQTAYKKEERLDYDEIVYPDKPFDLINQQIEKAKGRIAAIDGLLNESVKFTGALREASSKLERDLKFLNVRHGMKDEPLFSYLQGFCPEEYLGNVVSLAKSENAGYVVEDPDDPEETPTFITNPRWIRIIDPIFKFMKTLPGYKEYDISVPFLLFFSVFFAMLIGDAGYGLLFLLITWVARRRLRHLPGEPFFLMYVLSFATIIWGAITGTYFGFEEIAHLPFLNSMVISKINSFASGNQNFMIYLCFIIGAAHLTVAHLIMALRVINSFTALAQVGWISVIWGLFFTAGTLVIGNPFPPFAGYLMAAGALLVLFFSNPQRNVIKGILVTLGDLPLKIISSFSDIVSYIRLFAVGYASVIVAKSFNDMALAAGFNSVVGGLIAATILFFGHAINIVLGLMAVIVHGIRLNMLEFSGHLSMQWSGREYKPFKED